MLNRPAAMVAAALLFAGCDQSPTPPRPRPGQNPTAAQERQILEEVHRKQGPKTQAQMEEAVRQEQLKLLREQGDR